MITFIEKVVEVHNCCINSVYRDFPGDPVVKTLCFQSLVGELRSHVPGGAAKKKTKTKQCLSLTTGIMGCFVFLIFSL